MHGSGAGLRRLWGEADQCMRAPITPAASFSPSGDRSFAPWAGRVALAFS